MERRNSLLDVYVGSGVVRSGGFSVQSGVSSGGCLGDGALAWSNKECCSGSRNMNEAAKVWDPRIQDYKRKCIAASAGGYRGK